LESNFPARSETDLEEILKYIARDNPTAADAVIVAGKLPATTGWQPALPGSGSPVSQESGCLLSEFDRQIR